jgi:hypothetical protein
LAVIIIIVIVIGVVFWRRRVASNYGGQPADVSSGAP